MDPVEIPHPKPHMRDRKVGWIAHRRFAVRSGSKPDVAAVKLPEMDSPHPRCPLLRRIRIEDPRPGENGTWNIDVVYWLPPGRDKRFELEAATPRSA